MSRFTTTTTQELRLERSSEPSASLRAMEHLEELDTSIYCIFGEVEVAGWRAGGGVVGCGGFRWAVAGASG